MNRNELFTLVQNGITPLASAKFSKADANSAAINAICEHLGIGKDATTRDIKRVAPEAFALIEEAIDIALPKGLTDVMGAYAEIKTFARDAEVVFQLGKRGHRRARLTITKGARGGIYKAARLDTDNFQVPVATYTVGLFVTLEELILGTYTLAELYENILQGFSEIIYKETFNSLINAQIAAGNPNNYYTVDGATVTIESALDDSLAIAKQYGTPLIIGFYSGLSKISNVTTLGTPTLGADDLADIRNYGRVQVYKGNSILEIPNYLVNEKNANWELDEDYIFVIPADKKPVKVAFKGDMHIQTNTQPAGSEKWEAHKLMGIGVTFTNDYCVIKLNS